MLKVNLQLFAQDDTQEEVVDPQTNEEVVQDIEGVENDIPQEEVSENDFEDDVEDDIEVSEDVEVATHDQDTKQTSQENAQFKKMRLKAEKEAREKIEAEMSEVRKSIEAQKIALEQQQNERKILQEYLSPRKIYDYADEHGITEEMAEKMLRYDAQKVIDEHKDQVTNRFEKIQTQKKELQKSKYFKLLENDVDEILRNQPEQEFKNVFNYLVGERIDQLEKQLESNVEKRTVANMHDKARRRNVGGSSGNTPTSGLSEFGREFANFMGVDEREVASIVKARKRSRR